jgi:hypothetical protein
VNIMGNSAKRDTKAAEVKVWRTEALKLRITGRTIRQIADALGYSVGAVHKAISEEIAAIPAEAVGDLREVEGARLDADEQRLGELIEAHFDHATQEVVMGAGDLPGSGSDRAADIVVKAVAQRTSIRAQRAKLFGLNAPTRTELTGKNGGPLDIDITQLTDDQIAQVARGDIAGLAGEGGAGATAEADESDGDDLAD